MFIHSIKYIVDMCSFVRNTSLIHMKPVSKYEASPEGKGEWGKWRNSSTGEAMCRKEQIKTQSDYIRRRLAPMPTGSVPIGADSARNHESVSSVFRDIPGYSGLFGGGHFNLNARRGAEGGRKPHARPAPFSLRLAGFAGGVALPARVATPGQLRWPRTSRMAESNQNNVNQAKRLSLSRRAEIRVWWMETGNPPEGFKFKFKFMFKEFGNRGARRIDSGRLKAKDGEETATRGQSCAGFRL